MEPVNMHSALYPVHFKWYLRGHQILLPTIMETNAENRDWIKVAGQTEKVRLVAIAAAVNCPARCRANQMEA